MFSRKHLALVLGMAFSAGAGAAVPEYVIAISVDGMGSYYAQPILNDLPAIKRMFTEGAGTFNARTDAGVAVTLPNHTGMVTGRPMDNYSSPAIDGHRWSSNVNPTMTLHVNKALVEGKPSAYIASVFDVMHDNGKSTGMWASKTKFSLFDTSYNATNGAVDVTGVNNGRDKLDDAYIGNGTAANVLAASFISSLNSNPRNFSFVHFQDPDEAGHLYNWGSTRYNDALKAVDVQIGNILAAIEASSVLNGKTVVMLTADHGGYLNNHGNTGSLLDTQIPFVVWGAGVNAGDIYGMNSGVLLDPGATIPGYGGLQPIRNGNIANLSLDLLDLGAVPGSTIGVSQTIAVPEPTGLAVVGVLSVIALRRRNYAA